MAEQQNRSAEFKLRTKHRAGELLAEVEKHSGNRHSSDRMSQPPKVSELVIDRKQSERRQEVARVPEGRFEACGFIAAHFTL